MITIYGKGYHAHIVKPTIFPDGTSQVWKLPEWVFMDPLLVEWHFESEREIVDLLSLRMLLPTRDVTLHIPYLPYARQDKVVSNDSTFNLEVLLNFLEYLHWQVTTVDVHNPSATNFAYIKNLSVAVFHQHALTKAQPDYIVFPDLGARDRYRHDVFQDLPIIVFRKERDPATGEITGLKMSYKDPLYPRVISCDGLPSRMFPPPKIMIVDDICDGGATFIGVAAELRKTNPDAIISLCVTHGIFSKGREHLLHNGIDEICTTDSLPRNKDGFHV